MHEDRFSHTQIAELEKGLYTIVGRYFSDGPHSSTMGLKVTFGRYDILPYTAATYSEYFNLSSRPSMNESSMELNKFKAEVRRYLKRFGTQHTRFDIGRGKIHYGYISGPDDFPMTYLNAIYFD